MNPLEAIEAVISLFRRRTRARTLARDVLPEEEFKRLRRCGYIEVRGASGRLYRIARGQKVEVIGRHYLCVAPVHSSMYPADDLVVIWYLYITGDEEHFMRIARPIASSCYA